MKITKQLEGKIIQIRTVKGYCEKGKSVVYKIQVVEDTDSSIRGYFKFYQTKKGFIGGNCIGAFGKHQIASLRILKTAKL